MTVLVTQALSPPDDIVEDARAIADTISVRSVRVEDAVDDNWLIRAEGPIGEGGGEFHLTESEFESMVQSLRGVLGGTHSTVKTYYGVGTSDNQYLVRIEY